MPDTAESSNLSHQKHRIIVIIQARMDSKRLPGKVLREISGLPMLAHVVERAGRANVVDQVVVATTIDEADDAVARICALRGYDCYRGSMQDVLDRYYQAASAFEADIVVRLTADCPLIDPNVIDHTVNMFLGNVVPLYYPESSVPMTSATSPDYLLDFAANRLPPPWSRTYPIGLDTEVCSFAALQHAWRGASLPHQREHVMPYLYENSAIIDSRALPVEPEPLEEDQFRVLLVNLPQDYGSLRWTVDTAEDLELVRKIFSRLERKNSFTWIDVLRLFEDDPGLAAINAAVSHKSAYDVDPLQG